jgi:ubiquinone/menaquinone biosynthesis C-methylase UbiE
MRATEVFDRVATLYKKVRPTYPQAVYGHLTRALGLARFGVAVDVGCGAGQSLAGLMKISDQVIGIEPADGLRGEAQASYPALHIAKGSGEATGLPDASADLITVATAFYWFDKKAALAEVNRVLRRPGVFATYKYDFPRPYGPAGAVAERHLMKHWDAHRSRKLVDYDDTADLMRSSGYFDTVESPIVPYPIDYDAASFAEFMCSTSYVSAFLRTLTNPQEYVERFVAELREVAPGTIKVSFDIFMNIGTRR